ncbi:MAG: heme exporter protein CcmD [Pseudomonadota bacterium]
MTWLGQYAFDILLAYAITGALIVGLIVQSILAARAARRALAEEER